MIRSNDLRVWMVAAALAALGCGETTTMQGDSGTAPGEDGGPGEVSCATAMATAASTVGCNGGFVTAPAENAPGGRCTPGGDAMPAGTCTTEMTTCMGDLTGGGLGYCTMFCMPPADTDIDASSCPSGFRCFKYGEGVDVYGLCRRDCDATHECGEHFECAATGECAELAE